MKKENCVPKFLNFANITTVQKKGSVSELTNERCIFRVSVIRNILMNLIYESKYEDIDNKMLNCQMLDKKRNAEKTSYYFEKETHCYTVL